VLHQSAGQEDLFPIEIDLDQVRRQRETGMKGLGQVLKSFRDRPADFPVYEPGAGAGDYLRSLGPLVMPRQGSRAGLAEARRDVAPPRQAPGAVGAGERLASDDPVG
jgi:hypothetical protein